MKSLEDEIDKEDIGLYRDDGLMILCNANGQKTDRTRKYIIKVMKDLGFQIEIETNLKEVNFLDVTFNLNSGLYKPYKKPNDQLLYVTTSSDHPPQVIKQLPNSINRKLIENSSNKAVFDASKNEYEEALLKSGYKSNLEFQKEISSEKKNRRRRRNIIWFNPPFSQTVKTNVARLFLRLLDKHFPRSHILRKLFNRNTIKVSYSCMENVAHIIKKHNQRISSRKEKPKPSCNCKNKDKCPMNGKCQVQNVVYKCTVSATPNFPKRVYLGVAEGDWKQRFYNHKKSIKNKSYRNDTTLSSYLWDLREKHNVFPTLTWSVVKSVPGYSNISKRCLLCLTEKVLIATYENPEELLNKRSELMAKCRHNNKFLLSNYKSND